MTDSPSRSHCPDCGAPLPADSPQALCPACLLRQALASRTIRENPGTDFTPPSPEEIADKFPQFEISGCLGRGGMGVVYKARQKSLDRWVAIKILPPERIGEEKFSERFTREAQTLARLNHPNIVTVFDYGETGGLFYIVMEFVDGVNLRDLLRDGKLEPKQALAIVPPICDALQYAHEKGIVHRDIKPENLLLDRDGRIKIADFGIASLIGASGEKSGTPPYMAPEQSGVSSEVDHRADIYALGVVFYEMLTGERPEKDLVAPSRKVHLDVRLDEMVLRALEKEPERRYQTADEFKTVVETMQPAVPPPISPATSVAIANVPPRLSRKADIGACWAAVFFIGALLWFGPAVSVQVEAGATPPSPAWWQWVLMLTVLPLALTAPIATTLLGWIAVSQIRRSAGKIHGMWLAVFDGLLFPLLALDWVIAFLIHTFGIAIHLWTQNYTDESNARLILLTVIFSLIADCLIIRAIWRAVNRTVNSPPPPVGNTAPRWNPTVMIICGLLGIFLFIAFLLPGGAMLWQKQYAMDAERRSMEISQSAYRQHQAASERVEAEQEAANFGPEMKRTLKSAAVDRSNSFLSFETGYPVVAPADLDLNDVKAVWEWANKTGVDVVADTDEKVRGLRGFGLHVANVPDSEWEQVTINIGKAVAAEEFRYDKLSDGAEINQWVVSANTVSTEPRRTHTFAIRTRKGSLGLLQLLQVSDEPNGFVKFRYKLVR